jgi:hypothetical protein
MRRFLAIVLVLAACEQLPLASPSPAAVDPSASPSPVASTPTPPPEPYRGSLLYGEFLADNGPIAVRAISLPDGARRDLAMIGKNLDARFALSPDERQLAIYEKEDQHVPRTARWRVRMIDLASGAERQLTAPRVDSYEQRPWDIGWSAGGALLLASRPRLERLEANGARVPVAEFPAGTLGVTFRDPVHPGLIVAQTQSTNHVYLAGDDGRSLRLLRERAFVGVASYARRPNTDEVVELITRFDGGIAFSVLRADGETEYFLEGPRVEGLVELVGTTPSAAYVVWPVARDDPVAYGVAGTAFYYRVGYDGQVRVVDATRNWGAFAPTGVSHDGRALLIASSQSRTGYGPFAVAVCCAERPARPLLPPGDYFTIGWLKAP